MTDDRPTDHTVSSVTIGLIRSTAMRPNNTNETRCIMSDLAKSNRRPQQNSKVVNLR